MPPLEHALYGPQNTMLPTGPSLLVVGAAIRYKISWPQIRGNKTGINKSEPEGDSCLYGSVLGGRKDRDSLADPIAIVNRYFGGDLTFPS